MTLALQLLDLPSNKATLQKRYVFNDFVHIWEHLLASGIQNSRNSEIPWICQDSIYRIFLPLSFCQGTIVELQNFIIPGISLELPGTLKLP